MTSFKKMFLLTVVAYLLPLAAAFAGTVTSETVVGKFGFDWLRPEKAKCVAITAEAAAKFKGCTYLGTGETGSFTGNPDFYKCQVSAKSEYMIYKTNARCVEELETMQANGE